MKDLISNRLFSNCKKIVIIGGLAFSIIGGIIFVQSLDQYNKNKKTITNNKNSFAPKPAEQVLSKDEISAGNDAKILSSGALALSGLLITGFGVAARKKQRS